MNRKIKFKVYDITHFEIFNEKVVYEVTTIKYSNGNISEIGYVDNKGGYILRCLHQVELMQFTGLKDKNGVDIYEGDKLKNTHGYDCTVIFDNSGWIAKGGGFFIIPSYFWNCKITGNIHENQS